MKELFEDKSLTSEPLVKWIKTFKYDVIGADFRNLSQLIGSEYLDNVITLITTSRKSQPTRPNDDILMTVAERLHHLRKLMREIADFYRLTLKQIVMLPAPNLATISESTLFDECQEDMRHLLILILGCATQCNMKEMFVGRISELLDKTDQDQIEVHFELLANNSMTADSSTLGLDDNMLHMHTQVGQLTNERGKFSEKYYDCFEKHSTSTFDDGPAQDPLPILIRPVVPIDHGGHWQSAYSRQMYPMSSERNEEDVLVIGYRTKIKVSNKHDPPIAAAMSEADKEKLKLADEKIKKNEELEKEIYNMKQELHELEFHKKKNKELHAENAKLSANQQKFKDQMESSRRKEEDMIERLVDCQMKLDDAVAEREMDRQKIAELMQSKTNPARGNNNDDLVSESDAEGASNNKSTKNKRVQELEREIESLRTRLMEAQKQDDQSDEKWKFLDLQKEKMDARRQLKDAVEENDQLRRQNDKFENQLEKMTDNLKEAQEIANVTRSANDDQVSEFEERIKDLTKQVMLLRKKGGKLSGDQFKDLERQEGEVMYETIQELSNEVTKLKTHNQILRQECDKLKRDVEKVVYIERENERLSDENRALHNSLASREQNSELIEELRRQNLQLGIENKKLRRMIDTLRYILMQVDPYNKQKYHYITSI